jgi:bifunctional NMN adenylyltransferase/nudix hydrolase
MKTVGTIIGRFQVYELHAGHKHLIDWVARECDELVILLGTSEVKTTVRNPLSFELRKEMIFDVYPNARVFEIKDNPSNQIWSKNVDQILDQNFPGKQVLLYGSRDSFSTSYGGKFSVTLVPELPKISGTEMRNGEITPKCMESFRKGIIHAQKGRFPTSFQTVDIGLVNWEKREILLGRKRDDIPKGSGAFQAVLLTQLTKV